MTNKIEDDVVAAFMDELAGKAELKAKVVEAIADAIAPNKKLPTADGLAASISQANDEDSL